MNYILLSGGSGKRLWPLSNEVRSKQFIKILKSPSGELESMVQRVYRQINKVDKNANIIIATSKNQEAQIKNQLGNKVDISIEPERRDTFPAIALATLYLKDKKNLSTEDTVIISPVDPYVDDDYFKSLLKLGDIMKLSKKNIGLIGIKPTYPSEKYGYINPIYSNNYKYLKIDEEIERYSFVEKPSAEDAKSLIANNALWNGGVFCFKIGYILDKIKYKTYDQLYNNFDKLDKISFDYSVVEKEKDFEVVTYDGEWKDIGTWNTLTEVMTDNIVGDVILDDKSINTNVVNELNIPIICMGLKNLVVAASSDGIFVSNKSESSYNKPYVEKLDNRPMYEERAWGDFKILDMYKNSLVKHLYIKAGEHISYQLHHHRDEAWTIVDGEGTFILDDVENNVKTGDVLYIKKEQKHALKALNDLHFIEIQIGKELVEEDIERFEYKF